MEDLKNQSVKVNLGSVKDILKRAHQIRIEAQSPRWRSVSSEEKLKKIQMMFPEFGKAFPVVLRHIVVTGKFYKDVLKRFINLCKNKPHHSMDEFRDRQTDYMSMIYRKQHPRCSQREINTYRQQCRKDLAGEQEHMKKVMDNVKEEREKMHELNNEIKRSEILAFISKYKNEVPDDTETEINIYNDEVEEVEETDSIVVIPQPISKGPDAKEYNADVVLEQLRHGQRQFADDDDDDEDEDVDDKITDTDEDEDEDVDDKIVQ